MSFMIWEIEREVREKLSTRAFHCLTYHPCPEWKSKQEIIEAIKDGRFRQGKVRGLGPVTMAEICKWLGITPP